MVHLAPELWRFILSNLRQDFETDYARSSSALRQCCAVSHFVRALALPYAWRDIICWPRTTYGLATVSPWNSDTEHFHKHSAVAEHVQDLLIAGAQPDKEGETCTTICAIDSLVAAFPNLTTLMISNVALSGCDHEDHEPYLHPDLPLPLFHKLHLSYVTLPIQEELPTSTCFLQVASISTMRFRDTTWLSRYSKYYPITDYNEDDLLNNNDSQVNVISPPHSLLPFTLLRSILFSEQRRKALCV